MKLFQKLFFILFLITTTSSYAQNKQYKNTVNLTGKITDRETNQPLEYATIILKNIATKEISGGISSNNGSFNIQVKKGTYAINIEFLGFKSVSFNNN